MLARMAATTRGGCRRDSVMVKWMLLVLVACGPARREDPKPGATPPVDAGAATPVASPVDAGAASPMASPVDAGVAGPVTPCFCFSWVPLDENGQRCFATQATCDTEFTAFGRSTKIACSRQTEHCSSYACRKVGKECFAL